MRTIAFDHPEFLPSETLKEIEKLFFSPSSSKTRPIFIVGLESLMRFSSQLSPGVLKVLQKNTVTVPSLRDRPDDLRRHILEHVSKLNRLNNCIKRVSFNALGRLLSCDYDENFHSLFALIETLYGGSDDVIECDETLLQKELRQIEMHRALPELGGEFQLENYLQEMRNLFIGKAVARAGGNLLTAAKLLGIDVSTLSEFIKTEKK